MTKLIPLIYFYAVSLVGLVLLIIGIFADVHFLVNKFSYAEYPLPYSGAERCVQPQPVPLMNGETAPETGGTTSAGGSMGTTMKVEKGTAKIAEPMPSGDPSMIIHTVPYQMPNSYYNDCLKQVALERKQAEVGDMEKGITYTLVGLIVFSLHFYYARKKSTA